ncbi:hypothetical protein BDV59DRAFT_12673 [Aspergillus ambiguus]|uniref:retropepsin-like aspartic protease n=1 Tax=Aspergillus ambiguus TaxID=176160 RepID=UPI003CCDE0AD
MENKIPRLIRNSQNFFVSSLRKTRPVEPIVQNLPEKTRGAATHFDQGEPPNYKQEEGVLDYEQREDEIAAQLTESLDVMFAQRPISGCRAADVDFIYDILIFTAVGGKIRRRLVVDFRTDINVMSDSVYKRLNMIAGTYEKPLSITLPGRGEVKSIGTVVVQWCLYGDSKIYQTKFYVVRGWHTDLVLGRPSVREHQLYRKDAGVISRLNTSSYESQ